MQTIDMGGFQNEELEIRFGKDKYIIKLDPPIEAYRLILSMQGIKLKTKEDWDKYKNVVTIIICESNPKVDRKAFFKSLTIPAAMNFIKGYTAILYQKGDSKNLPSPPAEERKQKDGSKLLQRLTNSIKKIGKSTGG